MDPNMPATSFAQFAKEFGFQHTTSSPEYAQSNGAAERAVQTFKNILKKNGQDLPLGLLAYRNTPIFNGYSPAQLLMGRRLQDKLQLNPSRLIPKSPNLHKVRTKEMSYKQNQSDVYNRRHRAKHLPEVPPGTRVWVRGKTQPATVVSHYRRSYTMNTYPSGAKCVRNRRFLSVLAPPTTAQADDPPVPVDSPNYRPTVRSATRRETPGSRDRYATRRDTPGSQDRTIRSSPVTRQPLPVLRPQRQAQRPAWHKNYVWGK